MGKKALSSVYIVLLLVISLMSNIQIFGPLVMTGRTDPGDISESWDNTTTLNVTVLQAQPRINWYDFQYNNSGTWESKLNQQIDVDASAEYRFIVNISSDQGWADIEYVFINAWHDGGDDNASSYNSTSGGNINLNITYDNSSETAEWVLHWPNQNNEVILNSSDCNETEEVDTDGSDGNTECYNITFAFTPGCQFRNAPGDTHSWDSTAGFNDTWTWNFNISVHDDDDFWSYHNPSVGETINEFGVYTYTEIASVGWPTITGSPGAIAYNDSAISMVTRSNGNYSLAVNVSDLVHETFPAYTIDNDTIWTKGGDLTLTQFSNTEQWYYGGIGSYQAAETDGLSVTTSDIEWACSIPLAAYPGDYEATIYYHLMTET